MAKTPNETAFEDIHNLNELAYERVHANLIAKFPTNSTSGSIEFEYINKNNEFERANNGSKTPYTFIPVQRNWDLMWKFYVSKKLAAPFSNRELHGTGAFDDLVQSIAISQMQSTDTSLKEKRRQLGENFEKLSALFSEFIKQENIKERYKQDLNDEKEKYELTKKAYVNFYNDLNLESTNVEMLENEVNDLETKTIGAETELKSAITQVAAYESEINNLRDLITKQLSNNSTISVQVTDTKNKLAIEEAKYNKLKTDLLVVQNEVATQNAEIEKRKDLLKEAHKNYLKMEFAILDLVQMKKQLANVTNYVNNLASINTLNTELNTAASQTAALVAQLTNNAPNAEQLKMESNLAGVLSDVETVLKNSGTTIANINQQIADIKLLDTELANEQTKLESASKDMKDAEDELDALTAKLKTYSHVNQLANELGIEVADIEPEEFSNKIKQLTDNHKLLKDLEASLILLEGELNKASNDKSLAETAVIGKLKLLGIDPAIATDPSKLPGLLTDINEELTDVKYKVGLFNNTQVAIDKVLAAIKLKEDELVAEKSKITSANFQNVQKVADLKHGGDLMLVEKSDCDSYIQERTDEFNALLSEIQDTKLLIDALTKLEAHLKTSLVDNSANQKQLEQLKDEVNDILNNSKLKAADFDTIEKVEDEINKKQKEMQLSIDESARIKKELSENKDLLARLRLYEQALEDTEVKLEILRVDADLAKQDADKITEEFKAINDEISKLEHLGIPLPQLDASGLTVQQFADNVKLLGETILNIEQAYAMRELDTADKAIRDLDTLGSDFKDYKDVMKKSGIVSSKELEDKIAAFKTAHPQFNLKGDLGKQISELVSLEKDLDVQFGSEIDDLRKHLLDEEKLYTEVTDDIKAAIAKWQSSEASLKAKYNLNADINSYDVFVADLNKITTKPGMRDWIVAQITALVSRIETEKDAILNSPEFVKMFTLPVEISTELSELEEKVQISSQYLFEIEKQVSLMKPEHAEFESELESVTDVLKEMNKRLGGEIPLASIAEISNELNKIETGVKSENLSNIGVLELKIFEIVKNHEEYSINKPSPLVKEIVPERFQYSVAGNGSPVSIAKEIEHAKVIIEACYNNNVLAGLVESKFLIKKANGDLDFKKYADETQQAKEYDSFVELLWFMDELIRFHAEYSETITECSEEMKVFYTHILSNLNTFDEEERDYINALWSDIAERINKTFNAIARTAVLIVPSIQRNVTIPKEVGEIPSVGFQTYIENLKEMEEELLNNFDKIIKTVTATTEEQVIEETKELFIPANMRGNLPKSSEGLGAIMAILQYVMTANEGQGGHEELEEVKKHFEVAMLELTQLFPETTKLTDLLKDDLETREITDAIIKNVVGNTLTRIAELSASIRTATIAIKKMNASKFTNKHEPLTEMSSFIKTPVLPSRNFDYLSILQD